MRKHLIFDWDGTLFDPYERNTLYPDAREAVAQLGAIARLSLLTAGDFALQWFKLNKSSLEACFEPVRVVPDKPDKREALKLFMPGAGIVDASLRPEDVIVIGDRAEFEIAFGRECGYTTVRMMRGPHRRYQSAGPLEEAHVQISRLAELVALVREGRI